MNVCVFLGPTLSVEAASRVLDAVYLPPAAQGDVLAAVESGAEVIGIVDGYFQGAPSVWHKEIMWALSLGVHVLGSSSMGALRAAELSAFGMQGVGRIYEAYRDGELTGDDEVALVHGPKELGYHASTVPLVNVRASARRAAEIELIGPGACARIVDAARALNYWDRNYDAVIEACESTVDGQELAAFSVWIDEHAVDQKRDDALALLEVAGEIGPAPFRAAFAFQRTDAWSNLVDEVHARPADADDGARDTEQRVLDELRLEPALYRQLASVQDEDATDERTDRHAPARVMERLAASGQLEPCAARAADKTRALDAAYGGPPVYADAMLSPADVLAWYFEDDCGIPIPADLDAHAREHGLADAGALCRMLLHELLYQLLSDPGRRNGVST